MKFAKELERDLVPEWRLKYLDYKVGKKKLKAINRALRNVTQTPRMRLRGGNTFTPSPFDSAPKYSFVNRGFGAQNPSDAHGSGDLRALALTNSRSQHSLKGKANGSRTSLARDVARNPEEQPLNGGKDDPYPGLTRYGSIIGSPPSHDKDSLGKRTKAPPSLKLPGAALDPEHTSPNTGPSVLSHSKTKSVQLPPPADNAFEIGKTRSPNRQTSSLPSRYKSVFSPKRVNSTPAPPPALDNPRPLLKRVFSMSHKAAPPSPGDVPLEAFRELDVRQAEFFNFLDMQLEKVEQFYRQKEDEATERLKVLRDQLHIMRDCRLDELITRQTAKMKAKEAKHNGGGLLSGHGSDTDEETGNSNSKGDTLNASWLNPIDTALQAVQAGRYGGTTKAMNDLATPTGLVPQDLSDEHRDYTRRPDLPDVPYQSARRKLKVALQEYYRGLELLKSYALLNRTAFRKINKKYDKTVNARPSMRYMTEKVSKSWFVQSDVVDGHIRAVEDLYARYFEKGNHKVAVGKLRIKIARAGDYTENSFRNGLTLAAGLVFGAQGVVYGAQLLWSDDDDLAVNTSFLLQIYAGYFLMNFLFLLFCIACRIWHETKINYVFVFEYDTRHHLDWRQLSELPCFFIFLLGLFMWLNFSQFGGEDVYIFYPVILIAITTLIIMLPVRILYYRSRLWLVYSVWRLLLAGLYPVEFRDFYLGDMFCSLTYTMGNIELFFCLFAHDWNNPNQCNSSHSRLLGFFATLPGIWRALQCIRRYYDTRNIFPHLVNCGKYTATILFYVTLSIYRIDKTPQNRAAFITFAIFNSIYCSIWDVFMDWSLGDPKAKHPFLRQTLGYKKVWMYYTAMVIDPILRFNWVFYAIIPLQIQHSAITSFAVATSEVCRRGMWTLFRVENEHCTNVGRFRASRDIPLPYDIPSSPEVQVLDSSQPPSGEADSAREASSEFSHPRHAQTFSSAVDPEQSRRPGTRRRATSLDAKGDSSPLVRGLSRVGNIMRDAHAQDFERRKKPELGAHPGSAKVDDDSDDDEDDCNSPSRNGSGTENEHDGDDHAGEDQVERENERDISRARRDVEIGRGEGSSSGGA